MLNPILFTENVVRDFLRFQLTAYPFADPNLYEQMRALLNLDQSRNTPLLKGPYVSLSRPFRAGATIQALTREGVLHPLMSKLAPYPNVYGHQEQAIRAIVSGQSTLVSTGTGSGKTECFLYPVISRCLSLRDERAPEGIIAVLVYPMNALAEDQLGRLRGLLAGTGISFGMYVGKTPERTADVAGKKLKAGSSAADYRKAVEQSQGIVVHPPEERVSREQMRARPPRILLTNVKQLELLLTRQRDVELFNQARLDFLVFDEAHTFSGASGAETACLIRRLRAYCGRTADETVCIATSATIVDVQGPDAGLDFASRFFGVEKARVTLVTEQYEPDAWAGQLQPDRSPEGDPIMQLQTVLAALSADEGQLAEAVCTAYLGLTGHRLHPECWQEELYAHLSSQRLVRSIVEGLTRPRLLAELASALSAQMQRTVTGEEVLTWLALGAAARRESRPLLRPVVHAFVRGVGGAVVTFPTDRERAHLWLAAEDAASSELCALPITTCTTCGQHYFVHAAEDFQFTERQPGGGRAVDNRRFWPALSESHGGRRLILLDRLITDEVDDDPDDIPRETERLFFCRFCGALHPAALNRCDGCGRPGVLVPLLAVRQKGSAVGSLYACICCGTRGRQLGARYREPAREVRAIAVSDVHVLAQNMIHHAERRRLLVFADNRQDAAFQAGWMQDHARRYRLRSLMYEQIVQGAISIGDLTAHLDDLLERNEDLSRAILPEVWRAVRKEAEGNRHGQERRQFLRFQILREITTGLRQRIGLEPWGRIRVEYAGLGMHLEWIQHWAAVIACTPETLVEGVAALLDIERRNMLLLDREDQIFTRFWQEGSPEIQKGYLPLLHGVPKAFKLRREPGDRESRVRQWLSETRTTTACLVARRWGVVPELMEAFFESLWKLLTDELRLIVPVQLRSVRNRPVAGAEGACQIDADRLRIAAHQGVYRCTVCRRTTVRATPRLVCMNRYCSGTLQFEAENIDDYDLKVLDEQFHMLIPREHSAQVPAEERERIENLFKGNHESVNTLVATPTLELGVDIGALDIVLMRNVPPLPANYWQRAGRAGRRFRMAVNLTYARGASHDRAYFADPLRMLAGSVTPPRINLKNALMIGKHVHAAVLTVLNRLVRDEHALSPAARESLSCTLDTCFPEQIRAYLFDEAGNLLKAPVNVRSLEVELNRHLPTLLEHLEAIFGSGWPAEAARLVDTVRLRTAVLEMGTELEAVVARIWQRLQWAIAQMARLNEVRLRQGTLSPEEDALWKRCDTLIKRMKGQLSRSRSETEGYDDTNLFGVLAVEGFLPGYGLDTGSVKAVAQLPPRLGLTSFELPRPAAMALREYVPGNLIYANGNRFVPRSYRLNPDEPLRFAVDLAGEAVVDVAAGDQPVGIGATTIRAVPICDVDMPQQAHISDEEDYRFQLAVTVIGCELGRHGSGVAFRWQDRSVLLRDNVHLRLVNVGPSALLQTQLGYPVCLVCGQSRSPFASQAERDRFAEDHLVRCGRRVEPTGFYSDIVAHCLTLQGCRDRQEAYSLAESLRIGATRVLEMEPEDLQVLVLARPGQNEVDALLYDPMPGGSGLLEQLLSAWPQVVEAALVVCQHCPSCCPDACIDCLYTFRNAHYHRFLDRHVAEEKLLQLGDVLELSHEIVPRLPQKLPDSQSSNPEQDLRDMLLRAGFPEPEPQKTIALGKPLGATTPDFFYEDPSGRFDGVCLYLDGLSSRLHGNPETQERDRRIRERLRQDGYEVLEIEHSRLSDRPAMAQTFFKLGKVLLGRERAAELRENTYWFEPVDQTLNIDLSLFDTDWHPLICAVAKTGVVVEPGEDVSQNGQVIGTALAIVRLGERTLYLLDAQSPGCQAVQAVLQAQGQPALVLYRNDLDAARATLFDQLRNLQS